MAIRGPKPKDSSRLHQKSRSQPWTEVPNVRYAGKVPRLPIYRVFQDREGQHRVKLDPMTRSWWKVISRMPHCVNWAPSEWQFAITTALVYDSAVRGNNAAAVELRNREKVLGTTLESRRDLRIRYVDPAPKLEVVEEPARGKRDELEEMYGAD